MLTTLSKIISKHYSECTPNTAMTTTSLWRCSTEKINKVCENIGDITDAFTVVDAYENILGWIRISVVHPDSVKQKWLALSNADNHYAVMKESSGRYLLYQACVNIQNSEHYAHDENMPPLDWLEDLKHHLFYVVVQQQIDEDDYGFEEVD